MGDTKLKMNIEAFVSQTVSREALARRAISNLERAAMFEVVISSILAQAQHDGGHTSDWLKVTKEMQSLTSHSIVHAMNDVADYGTKQDQAYVAEKLESLRLFRQEGLLSPDIFPTKGISAEITRFGTELAGIDYENTYLK